MKVIKQTPTQLTLKEQNWVIWFHGALFAGVGVFIIVQALHAREVPILLGIIFFVIGLLALLVSEINICDFNADTGQFTLKRQRLLGLPKSIRHPLSKIERPEVKSSSGPEATHKVVIVLLSGEHVPLSTFASSDYEKKQRTVMLIRNFLHKFQQDKASYE